MVETLVRVCLNCSLADFAAELRAWSSKHSRSESNSEYNDVGKKQKAKCELTQELLA